MRNRPHLQPSRPARWMMWLKEKGRRRHSATALPD
jgi:hypothetical protein